MRLETCCRAQKGGYRHCRSRQQSLAARAAESMQQVTEACPKPGRMVQHTLLHSSLLSCSIRGHDHGCWSDQDHRAPSDTCRCRHSPNRSTGSARRAGEGAAGRQEMHPDSTLHSPGLCDEQQRFRMRQRCPNVGEPAKSRAVLIEVERAGAGRVWKGETASGAR